MTASSLPTILVFAGEKGSGCKTAAEALESGFERIWSVDAGTLLSMYPRMISTPDVLAVYDARTPEIIRTLSEDMGASIWWVNRKTPEYSSVSPPDWEGIHTVVTNDAPSAEEWKNMVRGMWKRL